jgi:hypothetical protein
MAYSVGAQTAMIVLGALVCIVVITAAFAFALGLFRRKK